MTTFLDGAAHDHPDRAGRAEDCPTVAKLARLSSLDRHPLCCALRGRVGSGPHDAHAVCLGCGVSPPTTPAATRCSPPSASISIPFAGNHVLLARALHQAADSDAYGGTIGHPYGLQLVSGVSFVVLLFAGTASAGSVALLKDLTSAPRLQPTSSGACSRSATESSSSTRCAVPACTR